MAHPSILARALCAPRGSDRILGQLGPDVHFLWRLGRFLSFISLIFSLESGDISRNFFDGNGCNGCNGYGLSLSPPAPQRVFSLLKWMFGDQQMSTLADIIQAALMLRYNKRPVG